MEKDSFELGTGLAAETDHCDNTSQIPTETTSSPLQALPGGYEVSRFNALRHGVLSAHTVLPWEDKAEYEALLRALAEDHAPHGPTEEHLVEEIAGVIWRKRRLRLAEGASYRRSLEGIANPSSNTIKRALLKVDPIIDALTDGACPATEDFSELKRREASAQKAVEILDAGEAGAYDAALAELDESTRESWEAKIAAQLEDFLDEEDPEAFALAQHLCSYVLPELANHLNYAENRHKYIENRHAIREQVLGEALPGKSLESLSRYEVHLDRKLERMLAMLLRLQSLRRSNEVG
jgi:hypothetical protein